MKKQQKIIELRTAAKLKVAEIETKIAFARSEAAGNRARLMWVRAAELDGLEAGSTERYDVLAKYRAKLADANKQLVSTVAQLKYEIHQAKLECEKMCAAAEDDPEPDKENQETVYCDGSEHTARIVARRLINKLPHIPKGGSISVSIYRSDGDIRDRYWLNLYTFNGNHSNGVTFQLFAENSHDVDREAEFINMVRASFASRNEGGNSHVAEPLSRALDAIFGGNPVEQVDSLIADTVKDRKEVKNE